MHKLIQIRIDFEELMTSISPDEETQNPSIFIASRQNEPLPDEEDPRRTIDRVLSLYNTYIRTNWIIFASKNTPLVTKVR